jgi:hypothetical protein
MDDSFFGLFFLILLGVIVYVKKKRQLGKVWSGPVSATVQIADLNLKCSHCQNQRFQKREGVLMTSWVAFFHFECFNHSAACYTCTKCGHAEWFVCPQNETVSFERAETDLK